MLHKRKVSLLVLFLVIQVTGAEQHMIADPCTICKDGAFPAKSNKSFSIPGFPGATTCGELDSILALFLQTNATTEECILIQSLGSVCGCPNTITETSCNICQSGKEVAFPGKELPVLADLFLGYIPTCEILEAYLHSTSASDSLCFVAQSFIGDFCGCSETSVPDISAKPCSFCANGEPIRDPDKVINMTGFPFKTCGHVEEALNLLLVTTSRQCSVFQSMGSYCGCEVRDNACILCPDGSEPSFPDKPVTFVKEEIGGIIPTCAIFEAYAESFDADSKQCAKFQFGSGFCGCPAIENHCEFCPHDESIPESYRQKLVPPLKKLVGFTPTCEEAFAFQFQIPASDHLCWQGQRRGDLCGCNGGEWDYFNANTKAKKVTLAWAPRISAILSFFGAVAIIQDVIRDKKKFQEQIHYQLMLGMSCFDVVNCIAWIFSTAPIPVYDENGERNNIYGATGSNGTCVAQGFFLQLGVTSIFFNISLSIHYFLVIVKGWKARRLQSARVWLLLPPIVAGFSLSFGGLPLYINVIYGCYIPPKPLASEQWPSLLFFGIPVLVSLVVTSSMMGLVYWKVRQQSRASTRWRFSPIGFIQSKYRQDSVTESQPAPSRRSSFGSLNWNGNRRNSETQPQATVRRARTTASSNTEKEVSIQAFFYLFNIWLSWPVFVFAMLTTERIDFTFAFWVIVLALAPLQGFNNALVYFRPRIFRRMATRKGARIILHEPSQHSGPSASNSDSFFAGARLQDWLTSAKCHTSTDSLGGNNDTLVGQASIVETQERHGSINGTLKEDIEPTVNLAVDDEGDELKRVEKCPTEDMHQ